MGVAGGEPRRAARFAGCPFMERVLARHGGTLPRGLFPRGEASVAEMARAVHGEGGVVALGGAAGRMSGAASRPLASLSMGASLGPGAGGGGGDGGGGMDDFKRNELRELLDGGGARKKPAQRGPAPRAGGGKHSVRVAATSSSSPVSMPYARPDGGVALPSAEGDYEGIFRPDSKCPVARLQRAAAGVLNLPPRKPGGRKRRVKLTCPAPVVALRAALAATPQVRALRPRATHVRIASVAATSALTNVPLGAWRSHVDKFSAEWFVAVHLSIPLVVSLRKAVLLPRYAVLFTIASAVLGQALGCRLEDARCAAAAAADEGGIDGRVPGGIGADALPARALEPVVA